MGSLDASCLKGYSMLLGALLILVSVSGIGFGVFLLFGEPLAQQTYHTYRPNFEDIGELATDYLHNTYVSGRVDSWDVQFTITFFLLQVP